MNEQPKFAQTYNSKADNWENIRNGCIATAAAIYVYNLIDAVAAKGTRWIKISPKHQSISMVPVFSSEYSGMAMIIKF